MVLAHRPVARFHARLFKGAQSLPRKYNLAEGRKVPFLGAATDERSAAAGQGRSVALLRQEARSGGH
jgi:hypothetical protein